ncbi:MULTISPECIES: Rad52/Rad22 family DNA repair protein [unclassified Meiothermus]|uniref:Rad52/Rad22 family DNA repair protein n=1 Tax=unclassified Meiothermus TaxID=370471 RepID=UPI000D7BBFF3|nr:MULTISPECIES: Rad52/Rad22 family DNA repair protein [unclassified Meiothermus]PZA06734.1 DNA repair protein Rad52 [Meiothermus sp. Pnk-1]RYM36660.1 DNA repair protein Rad52 [Meiothermus sp. PNK-Is4]
MSDWRKLSEPFPASEVQWRVEALSKDKRRAMVVPYVDARTVLDRLDEVVGPEGWQDHYEVLVEKEGNYAVKCRLTLLEVSKEDVGEGDSLKAAFSDALKRAAVKFGVGRYLYRLEKQWVDHDPATGRFEAPQLEVEATPPEPHPAGLEEPSPGEGAAEAPPAKPEPQELIHRLIDRLKEQGMGKEVARIVMKYQGYGSSPEETKRLYGELRALLKGKT